MILAGFQVGWKVHPYSCYGNQITALLRDPLSISHRVVNVCQAQNCHWHTIDQNTGLSVHTEPEVWSEKPGREIKGMGKESELRIVGNPRSLIPVQEL